MTPVAWRVAGLALAVGLGVGTAWLSVAPYGSDAAEAGLRLAWSGRPERIEHCRRLSDAELEGVPAHMRQRVQCEGRFATYRLEVRVGDALVASRTLRGGGTRNDRPLHLLWDTRIESGRREVTVALDRIEPVAPDDSTAGDRGAETGTEAASDRERREGEERGRARLEALPRSLRWRGTLDLGPGEVALVTYDPDSRTLVLRRRGAP